MSLRATGPIGLFYKMGFGDITWKLFYKIGKFVE
jgi:hypothetical protein